MSDTVTLVIVLVVGILATNATIWGIVIVLMRRRTQQIREAWEAQGIIIRKGPETVSYVGHASDTIPMRGSGALILSDRDLRLMRFLPRREYVVPLAQITQVEQLRAWKGKYRAGSPVIVVHYHNSDGDDAIGFSLRNAPAWLEAIKAVIR